MYNYISRLTKINISILLNCIKSITKSFNKKNNKKGSGIVIKSEKRSGAVRKELRIKRESSGVS